LVPEVFERNASVQASEEEVVEPSEQNPEPPVDMCAESGEESGGNEGTGEAERGEVEQVLMHACTRKEDIQGESPFLQGHGASSVRECKRKSSEYADEWNPVV
jgi:hypothetical protein